MTDSRVLAPGTLLADRYEIVARIGQGGMSAVYRASDRRLPTATWAVKEMWADALGPNERDEAAKLFQREATLLAGLAHPALPRVSDFFTENGRQYLVMEFLEGETLEALVTRQGPLDVARAVRWATQLADALAYLHERPDPIIFRDVKPPNVMATAAGAVKLIDFGIARIYTSGKPQDTVAFGTPGFAAPEQYGRAQSDPRADVYGLGATLHYLLTARDPAESVFQFAPPSTAQPSVPPVVDDIVMRAVALEPDRRFATMREMEAALQGVLVNPAAPSSPSSAATLGPTVTVTPALGAVSASPASRASDARSSTRPLPLPVPAATASPSPSPSATPPSVSPSAPVSGAGMPIFEVSCLEFGRLRRGDSQRLNVRLRGDVDGVLASDARRWMRVEPRRLEGRDPVVQVAVYTRPLKEGRTHHAVVTLRTKRGSVQLPVSVTIEPARVGLLSVMLALFLTAASLVPLLGFVAALLLAFQYFTCPLDERPALRPFALATVAFTICNGFVVALAVVLVRSVPHWVPWLQRFTGHAGG